MHHGERHRHGQRRAAVSAEYPRGRDAGQRARPGERHGGRRPRQRPRQGRFRAPHGDAEKRQRGRGDQGQHQRRRGQLPRAQRARMPAQHHALPASVVEVLARERRHRAARPVANRQGRVEPDRAARRAQPPVEFVVLVARERRIETARGLERLAPKRPERHRVHRPRCTAGPVARAAGAEAARHRERHRALEQGVADGLQAPAHVGRTRAAERRHGAAHVVRRQHAARVAAHRHRVAGRGQRPVDPGGGNPPRVGDHAHLRQHGAGRLGGGGSVGAVGDDHLHRPVVVLRRERAERLRQRRRLVARGDQHRHPRQRQLERAGDRSLRQAPRGRPRPRGGPEQTAASGTPHRS